MCKFTASMEAWLLKYHKELIVPLIFGHTELLTEELTKEYLKWCQTEEGKEYLKGGSKYKEVTE